MYAQLVMFTLGPGTRSTAEKLGDKFAPTYTTAKGLKSVTFLGDDAIGEYGSLTLWESKEDVEAFSKIAGPQLEQALRGIVKGPPTIRLFEVYEPKV
jgi:heme-degrading monooxygenase HmoA